MIKLPNSEGNSKRKVPGKIAKSNLKHFKRMDNKCNIPDLVPAFPVFVLKI